MAWVESITTGVDGRRFAPGEFQPGEPTAPAPNAGWLPPSTGRRLALSQPGVEGRR